MIKQTLLIHCPPQSKNSTLGAQCAATKLMITMFTFSYPLMNWVCLDQARTFLLLLPMCFSLTPLLGHLADLRLLLHFLLLWCQTPRLALLSWSWSWSFSFLYPPPRYPPRVSRWQELCMLSNIVTYG